MRTAQGMSWRSRVVVTGLGLRELDGHRREDARRRRGRCGADRHRAQPISQQRPQERVALAHPDPSTRKLKQIGIPSDLAKRYLGGGGSRHSGNLAAVARSAGSVLVTQPPTLGCCAAQEPMPQLLVHYRLQQRWLHGEEQTRTSIRNNNVTAKKNAVGSITIDFGGGPGALNNQSAQLNRKQKTKGEEQ